MSKKLLYLLLLIATLISACGQATETPSVASVVPSVAPSVVPTPGPTATQAPPLVILVIPPDMNQEKSSEYQTVLYDLAQAQGYRFQVRNKLEPIDLEPALKIVIAFAPDPGIASLASLAPQTQFLAVNIDGVTAGGNISVIASLATRPDVVGFMAGFIGAIITEDYHTGIIYPAQNPDGAIAREAFRAGQEYFCGLCNPWAGPFEEYPLYIETQPDAKPSEYPAYADYLIHKKVDTMYIFPTLMTQDLLIYLAGAGVLVIGSSMPEKIPSNWVVTLQPDQMQSIRAAWNELIAGRGGQTFTSPLTLSDINTDFLTEGKLILVQQTLNEVLAGRVDLTRNTTTPLQP